MDVYLVIKKPVDGGFDDIQIDAFLSRQEAVAATVSAIGPGKDGLGNLQKIMKVPVYPRVAMLAKSGEPAAFIANADIPVEIFDGDDPAKAEAFKSRVGFLDWRAAKIFPM